MLWFFAVVALLIALPAIHVARRQRRSLPSHVPGHRSEQYPPHDPRGHAQTAAIHRGGGIGGGGGNGG